MSPPIALWHQIKPIKLDIHNLHFDAIKQLLSKTSLPQTEKMFAKLGLKYVSLFKAMTCLWLLDIWAVKYVFMTP